VRGAWRGAWTDGGAWRGATCGVYAIYGGGGIYRGRANDGRANGGRANDGRANGGRANGGGDG